MALWEPIDVSHLDRDDIEDIHSDWGDDFKNNLKMRCNKIRGFNKALNESTDEDTTEMTEKTKDAFKRGTIELIANQIYGKITILFNNTRKRLSIHKGEPMVDPIRNYDNFKLADDAELTYVYKRTVIHLGNIDEGLKSPWEIRKLGAKKFRLIGFMNITDEDVQPYRLKYVKVREKVIKLDKNLDERSKAIESSSTTDTEAIEMIEVTSKDIDTTVKDVEQDPSFIEPSERDKLLPLRELGGIG